MQVISSLEKADSYIRLQHAHLCVQCEILYEANNCPRCGSDNFINVAKVLGASPP